MAEEKQVRLSRKKFIAGTGASLAGLALAGGVGSLLAGCAPEQDVAAPEGAPSYPFAYEKLDLDEVAQRAYDSYKDGNG